MNRPFKDEIDHFLHTGEVKFDVQLIKKYFSHFYTKDWSETDYEMISEPWEAFLMGNRYYHFKSFCSGKCYYCDAMDNLTPKYSDKNDVWYFICRQHLDRMNSNGGKYGKKN